VFHNSIIWSRAPFLSVLILNNKNGKITLDAIIIATVGEKHFQMAAQKIVNPLSLIFDVPPKMT
jgi:hypothetical protein